MPKVRAKVAGGSEKEITASTVKEAAQIMEAEGYQAAVNGENASQDYQLRANDFISFARPVKAG